MYFRPPAGIGADVVRLFEALGLFREPLAGLEPQLVHVEGALEEVALDPLASLSGERFEALVSEAHAARTRIREAAYQQLHRDPYRSEMAAGILARVPGELDALNEEVVVTACIGLGFTIERPRGRRIFAIELGNGALVDGLPGVPGGSSYIGSFDIAATTGVASPAGPVADRAGPGAPANRPGHRRARLRSSRDAGGRDRAT